MLYVHVPFCHSKCAYCDFYSTPNSRHVGDVVDAIVAEHALRAGEVAGRHRTAYVGGGTPSMLDDDRLAKLAALFPAGLEECTLEANPEDVDAERTARWRSMGFDRVSMGLQSLVDSELAAIGRRHSAAMAVEAVGALRSAGFDNISLDLIYGLPGQTVETWRYSLTKLLDMRPEHFSAYMLSYEPGTRLTAMVRAGRLVPTDESAIVEMYAILCEEARARGYDHYEISNFALPGRRARHNSGYWRGEPYIGLGPSAHSFDGTTRRVNPSDIRTYLQAITAGGPAFEIDDENDDNRFNDLIITRLRTAEGLDAQTLEAMNSVRRSRLMADAAPFIAAGSLVGDSAGLRIPESSWLVSDNILRSLLQVD